MLERATIIMVMEVLHYRQHANFFFHLALVEAAEASVVGFGGGASEEEVWRRRWRTFGGGGAGGSW